MGEAVRAAVYGDVAGPGPGPGARVGTGLRWVPEPRPWSVPGSGRRRAPVRDPGLGQCRVRLMVRKSWNGASASGSWSAVTLMGQRSGSSAKREYVLV